jgi:hypothetical protein
MTLEVDAAWASLRKSPIARIRAPNKYGIIKYDLVPQTTYAPATVKPLNFPKSPCGHQKRGYYPTTIYVKVPVGRLKVSFKDGIVDSLDQTEGTLVGAGQVSVVTPPVNVYW